jgi:signal transduction histidine kinase
VYRRHGPFRHGHRLAIVVGAVQVIAATAMAQAQDLRLDGLGYTLLVAGPLALVFRQRAPVAALAVAAAAAVVYVRLPYPGGAAVIAAIIALFVAVREGRRIAATATVGLSYLAYLLLGRIVDSVAGHPVDPGPGVVQAVVTAVWVLIALALAEANKVRREQFAQMAKVRAEEARARAEQRRRQASEERLKIAQELHDVLGHHLSLINVQAGVGLHLMDSKPEQARAALTAIKEASAEALREVRSVLSVLNPSETAAPRTPAPGLDRVGDLVADAAAAGLPVATDVTGTARPLPSEVDRAAYRIVQEALTNVRRHAGPGATASLHIEYGESTVTVILDDDGTTEPSTVDSGGGITGMRERATALGGELTAAPRPTGGFRVRAVLPT